MKTIEYATHLVDTFGKKMIENNLMVELPKDFFERDRQEKIDYLLTHHSRDLEEDMICYLENK